MGLKRVKLFNHTLEVVYKWMCLFGERIYLFRYICPERLNPFQPNGCVCSVTVHFGRTDVSVRRTDVYVQIDRTRSIRMNVFVWEQPISAE